MKTWYLAEKQMRERLESGGEGEIEGMIAATEHRRGDDGDDDDDDNAVGPPLPPGYKVGLDHTHLDKDRSSIYKSSICIRWGSGQVTSRYLMWPILIWIVVIIRKHILKRWEIVTMRMKVIRIQRTM